MNLKDVAYFNDSAISNSDLGVLKDSPWLFKQYKDRKIERITTDQFELGSLIHLSILEPDLFVVAEADKPSSKSMGKFIDVYIELGMTEEAAKEAHKQSGFKLSLKTILNRLEKNKSIKKYLDFIKNNNNKLILTKQQKYIINQVHKGISRNFQASSLLKDYEQKWYGFENKFDIFNEICLYGILEDVKIKGKLDKLIIDHLNKKIILVDIKSTSSSPYFRFKKVHNTGDLTIDYQGTGFFGSFKTFSYYRQLAFYKTLIAQNYKEIFNEYCFECNMIVVNTTNSYDCSVVRVSDVWLEYGRKEAEEYIFRYKEHEKDDNWNYPIIDSNKGLIEL